jgi:hypothetical protein
MATDLKEAIAVLEEMARRSLALQLRNETRVTERLRGARKKAKIRVEKWEREHAALQTALRVLRSERHKEIMGE